MSQPFKELELTGARGRTRVHALLDTGSDLTLARREVLGRVAEIRKLEQPIRRRAVDDREIVIDEGGNAVLLIHNTPIGVYVYVVPDLVHEFILGADIMRRYRMVVTPAEDGIVIPEVQVMRPVDGQVPVSGAVAPLSEGADLKGWTSARWMKWMLERDRTSASPTGGEHRDEQKGNQG